MYTMCWDKSNLGLYLIAIAPYGGPIALLRDVSRGPPTTSTSMPILYIFNSAGKTLAQTPWSSGKVIHIGWTTSEQLLCVQDEGTVLVYNIFGKMQKHFGMGETAKEQRIIQAKTFTYSTNTGLAVMTSFYRIIIVTNVEAMNIRQLAEISDLRSTPIWHVITSERSCNVLVAKNANLYTLDLTGQLKLVKEYDFESIIDIAVSFNQQLIAVYGDNGGIWIGTKDFKTINREIRTDMRSRPKHLEFCGTGAIVCCYTDEMMVFDTASSSSQPIRYSLEEPVYCSAELDGVRILSSFDHEFLHKVETVLQTAYLLGTMEAHNQLIEAYQQFTLMSQKADEYLRNITEKLSEAVANCIKCATLEYDSAKCQKLLLNAASFGKTFLTEFDPTDFLTACEELRVLNELRSPKIGIGISYKQFKHLSLPVVLDRLILRKHFALAVKICEFLKLNQERERIFGQWATFKISQSDKSDEVIADCIVGKLGTNYMAYAHIAEKALKMERRDLAARLLEFEPRSSKQVPMLLKMQRNETALSKAIESGDVDLIYQALLHLKDTMAQVDFLHMLTQKNTQAFDYYLQYCRQNNRGILKDLYSMQDNFMLMGQHLIMDSYENETFTNRIDNLKEAARCFQKARCDWLAKQTEDQVKLLEQQKRLEVDFSQSYIDLSLNQTITKLIGEGRFKLADQLKKDFKISEKSYYYIKVEALAESDRWSELEDFGKAKKSPIGYEHFVEMCIKYNKLDIAEKYVVKVPVEDRPRLLFEIGKVEEAIDLAAQNKDIQVLERLGGRKTTKSQKSDLTGAIGLRINEKKKYLLVKSLS
ncbi:DgyrCDS10548 [Dimorphilus gyrociliatus]|uniref:Vacuolar protein sorting-associated protein 16 homolog n=1 Tax=Dimorphilus gyrociliatus TaxID=2664684 RepID=A0A7I8W1N5_9ANNE|nr:DgyrCDS10548 [Dimorphilus gyrociliatus]